MKRILLILLALSIGLSPTAWAVEVQETNQFLIELDGVAASDIEAAINASGGHLKHDLGDIGYAHAYSDDPAFASNLSGALGVAAVTRDLSVQWVPDMAETGASPVEMETPSPMGHIVDPNLAVWGACQWNVSQIDTQLAWAKGLYGMGAKVAVLDTGTDPFHQELAPNVDVVLSTSTLSPGSSPCGPIDELTFFDFDFHGTFVSGIIAAQGLAMAGVAPDASIVGVKVLNCLGFGSFGDVIAGIVYAANQPSIDVINMSLGAYFPRNPGAGPLIGAMAKAVNYAQGVKGKLVVSSAGNSSADLQHDGNMISLPAEAGSGVATWAGDIDGALAGYSNHGANQAILGAGGGDITPASPLLPLPGCPLPLIFQMLVLGPCSSFVCPGINWYTAGGGTSFSAPAVSGVAALLDGKYGGAWNGNQLKTGLKNTADDLGKKNTDNLFGHGRVNADKATDL